MTRRSDFGKTPTPANSTTEGAIYNTSEVHAMVPPDATGTLGKHHRAGRAIRQRAVDRYETARRGGTHTAAPAAKNPYKKSGTHDRAVPHGQGTKQL